MSNVPALPSHWSHCLHHAPPKSSPCSLQARTGAGWPTETFTLVVLGPGEDYIIILHGHLMARCQGGRLCRILQILIRIWVEVCRFVLSGLHKLRNLERKYTYLWQTLYQIDRPPELPLLVVYSAHFIVSQLIGKG